jgi:hypothetical protein
VIGIHLAFPLSWRGFFDLALSGLNIFFNKICNHATIILSDKDVAQSRFWEGSFYAPFLMG